MDGWEQEVFSRPWGFIFGGDKNCGVSHNGGEQMFDGPERSFKKTDNRFSRSAREPEFCHIRTMFIRIDKLEIGYVYVTIILVYIHY